MDKRKVLGRGLDSLIPAARSVAMGAAAVAVASGETVQQIPLEEIERNPYQTRTRADEKALEELAASIQATGVLQPIVLRYKPRESGVRSEELAPVPAEGGRGPSAGIKYQLIAGERRWLASKKAGKATIPAIVKQVSNEQAMEMTIIENLQREDLNPMDQARAFERLGNEFGLTQEEMAAKTGKDRASIGNFMRLLRLPAETQVFVENGGLSMGHAKALLALEDAERIKHFAYRVINEDWSVRTTEYEVQKHLYPEKQERRKKPRHVDPNVEEAEQQLQAAIGLKVRINDFAGKGSVVIEYNSIDDFDRILEALGARK